MAVKGNPAFATKGSSGRSNAGASKKYSDSIIAERAPKTRNGGATPRRLGLASSKPGKLVK